ncbi:MAG TPA: adenylate/guanylate cyclase domain-containing protein, partial [Candidatus Limnocylindria bacterium]|nr:adenylate/guanylate cyclase domain-containing protein [Candidatus Limnocylindria bacterium]
VARDVLMGVAPGMRTGRRFFSKVPSDPRCKLCASPFAGPVAPVLGLIGKKPFPGNPKYCTFCFNRMIQKRTGAEVECSILFADVRGSTALAEKMSASEFRDAMDSFFAVASRVLVDHEAFVDKFVGDEVMAFFIPAMTNEQHALRAIEAGRALLAAVAASETPLPIGVGVNTGVAFVGTVGTEDKVEFTAVGDPVNVGARLAVAAGPGELLVSVVALQSSGLAEEGLERRALELKGKTEKTDVVVMAAP